MEKVYTITRNTNTQGFQIVYNGLTEMFSCSTLVRKEFLASIFGVQKEEIIGLRLSNGILLDIENYCCSDIMPGTVVQLVLKLKSIKSRDPIEYPERAVQWIEFEMTISSLAVNYASHPLSKLTTHNVVWTFYLFGQDSDNLNGRLQLILFAGGRKSISPISAPLQTEKKYKIKWIAENSGNCLLINGIKVNQNDGLPTIQYSQFQGIPLIPNSHITTCSNWYHGGGRAHSDFNGTVTNVATVGC